METPENKFIQRYTSFSFPPFIYIPKLTNKPKVGHIIHITPPVIAFSSQTWKESETYLYAIDLFNFKYYWEVHEVLEKIWLNTGKKSADGIFIQGFIQLSVVLLKKVQFNQVGLNRLAEKALPKLLSQKGVYLGIEVEKLVEDFKNFNEDIKSEPPIICLNFDS